MIDPNLYLPSETPAGRGKILIVDDDPTMRLLLSTLLSQNQFEVITADDGEAAVRAARERQPDLVLMDVSMPQMTGFEAAHAIKSNPALTDIPIIFLTARDEPADRMMGYKLGADDYIAKPFQTDELLSRITSRLTKYRRHLIAQAKARTETLSQLMVTLAHHINNALAVMLGRAEAVNPSDPDHAAKLADTVLKQGRRIRYVVECLEEMGRSDELITGEYVGMKDAMLDITKRLDEKLDRDRGPADPGS